MEKISSRRAGWGRRFVGAFVLAGALAAVPVASQGATFTVRATGDRTWKPAGLTVAAGSKVVWKNPSGDRHNVTAYKGAWSKNSTIEEGERTSFTFKKSGTYKYRCTLHSVVDNGVCSGMCGKVRVN
ncbi:MAG: Copper binding protein plastocyanin/azurin family [Actinomycetota bacterium]|jgi:plastocyanin|nr:Copper binding protein plastocyanin/azurin family [Actinomycetota bacterium]